MSGTTTPLRLVPCDRYSGTIEAIFSVRKGVFERFPLLIPAVGENYWRADEKHSKLLFVGEINYLDESYGSTIPFMDVEKWYMSDCEEIILGSLRKLFSNFTGHPAFVKVFNCALDLLKNAGIDYDTKKNLDEYSFYNYYLRTALRKNGKIISFTPTDHDSKIAGLALSAIIERLEPNLVIFLSKKAYQDFMNYIEKHDYHYLKVQIYGLNHPSRDSQWKTQDGEFKLVQILQQEWIK